MVIILVYNGYGLSVLELKVKEGVERGDIEKRVIEGGVSWESAKLEVAFTINLV
jgi:hypothetical protein